MPLRKCTNNGKSGYQWGDEGKCFTGPNAKKKAIRQGIAIEGPDKFRQKASAQEFETDEDVIKAVSDYLFEENYELKEIVATVSALRAISYHGGDDMDKKKKKKKEDDSEEARMMTKRKKKII